MTDSSGSRQLFEMGMTEEAITALASAMVTELAPEELPVFVPLSRAWFAAPNRKRRGPGGDDVLGFGLGETVELLTPVVLMIATKLASYLAEEFSKSLVKAAANEIIERIKQLFRGDAPDIVLSDEQLARLRTVALITAREEKLTEAGAERLASAIVAHLSGNRATG